MICGLCEWYALGNSLSFVLIGFVYGFRYPRFGTEELGLIAVHAPMISAMNDFGINSDKRFD